MITTIDERDEELIQLRGASCMAREVPSVGDFVRFADDVVRRISHVWDFDDAPWSIQTSDGGRFYMGDGYVSYSGALYPGVPGNTLTRTNEVADGGVWIFHHDHHTAHNGVDTFVPFKVWVCSMAANR